MERILPGILVVVTVLSCGGDALLQWKPVAHRYGGGLKKPSYGGHPRGHASSYVSAAGGHLGLAGFAGSGAGYGHSYALPNGAYGGGGHGGTYNAPSGGHGQVHNSAGGGSYGQPSSYSASYIRPFGMPEGHKFPYGGFTYKFPEGQPPSPPIRSSYKSKPYPDFIVRFKSPLYPPEVTEYGKQDVRPLPRPVPSSIPVYEPGEIPEAEIPIYDGGVGSGVNVGASYQTGGNIPMFVNQDGGDSGGVNQLLSNVPSFAHPPSSSIYLINGGNVAADKFQLDSLEPPQPNSFIELSKESVFGSTPEPGVIKPLTPDVVYSPDKSDDFKPMYIFGPVYFPKKDAAEGNEAAAVEAKSTATAKSEVEGCLQEDPKCNLKASSEVVVSQNSTADVQPEGSTEKPKKSSVGAKSSSSSLAEKDEEVADDAEGEGGGGSRGLIGVLKGILGVDETSSDDDEDFSRGDDRRRKTKGNSRPKDDEDDRDFNDDRQTKRRRRPNSSNTRTSTNNGKGSSSSSSSSRFRPTSGQKRFSSGGDNRRPRPHSDGSSAGTDASSESINVAGEKKQDTVDPDNGKLPQDTSSGFVPAEQSIENGGSGVDIGPAGQGEEEPDPIVGPVQIGFIGGPPPDASHVPYQPFFYPAGIPAFEHNPLSSDFPQIGNRPTGGGGSNVRRHFDDAESYGNTVNHVRNSRPSDGEDNIDVPVKSTSFYEGFERQGYRDYAPGIPYRDGAPIDQEPADSSSSHVTENNVVDETGRKSDIDTVSTAEYVREEDASTTNPLSFNNYPRTSSYHDDSARADVTASYDDQQITSSQRSAMSYLHGSYPYAMSSEASHAGGESAAKNEVTEHAPSSTLFYNDDYNDSQTMDTSNSRYSNNNNNNDNNSSSSSFSTTSSYGKQMYASVTRRPFPSFYKYRTSYRPKKDGAGGGGGDENYIAPTTYRPASFRLSSRSTTPRPSSTKIDALVEERDVSATIQNSVVQDDYHHVRVTSESTPSSNIAPYHSHMDTANSEALVQIHEFSTDVPFGSRISVASKRKALSAAERPPIV